MFRTYRMEGGRAMNIFDKFFGMNPMKELDRIHDESMKEKKPDASERFDRGEDLLVKAYRDAVIEELFGNEG